MASFKKFGNKKETVKHLIEQGLTKQQICDTVGMARSTLNTYLEYWGLSKPKKGSPYEARRKSKYDHLRGIVKNMMLQGRLLFDIADAAGIPRGSIAYLAERWGFKSLQLESRGEFRTESGKIRNNARHKPNYRGEKHHFHGLVALRGQWVTREEFIAEAKKLIERDLTYAQMTKELGVSQATLWTRLKEAGLLQGLRTKERTAMWRGGHRKYRGPGWAKRRLETLRRDNYTCQDCGKTNAQELKERGKQLSAHHINPYEISHDSELDNLVALCNSCHMKREYHEGRFSKKE